MRPFFQKLAVFSLLLATFCVNAIAADGGKWIFSPVSWGITDGLVASVVWGNGQFVAVGRYGAVSTSPDGRNWTARSSGVDFDLLSVAWGEEAGYVVLGDSGRIVLTSTDGVDWVKHETFIPENVYVVLYAGGKYFASTPRESYLSFYYSFGGVNWTVCSIPRDKYGGLNTVTYGNGIFIGVQDGGSSTLVSTDGVTWETNYALASLYAEAKYWLEGPPYPPPSILPYDGLGLRTVAYGNSLFLAGGFEAAFGWSENGTVWEIPWAYHWEGNEVVMPEGWDGHYHHIIHDGTRFVVIRYNYDVGYEMYFTADGKSLKLVYSGFPKHLSTIASDGNASIVVLSEDGQLGLLTRDTTASSVRPTPSSPKPTPGLSLRQSGKTLTITLPRTFRHGAGIRPAVALYSISGKKQKISPIFNAISSSISLSTSHIPSGIYVLTVSGVGKESWRKTIVVN